MFQHMGIVEWTNGHWDTKHLYSVVNGLKLIKLMDASVVAIALQFLYSGISSLFQYFFYLNIALIVCHCKRNPVFDFVANSVDLIACKNVLVYTFQINHCALYFACSVDCRTKSSTN